MLFPAGFWVDADKKVYTPEISILYRLASNKKDLPDTEKSSMVQHIQKCFNEIRDEIDRWRDILAVPYQEYLSSKTY